ncbi:MAG: FMN-binding protein [Gaiellaceae bacterium]
MTAAATLAATQKKVVTTKTVTGPQEVADRWGYVEVTLVVKKTTTTIGTHKKVARKITGVSVPVYPNHTDRSVFINSQAIPWLKQEVLQAQFNPNIQMVGGATATSGAFMQSLQAALLTAKRI